MMITVFLLTYDLMMIIINMTIDNHYSSVSSDDDDHDEDLKSYNKEGTLICCHLSVCWSVRQSVHQQFPLIFFAEDEHIVMKFGIQVYHDNI